MNILKFGFRWLRSHQVCATALLVFGFVGCGGEEIQVYQTHKEHPISAQEHSASGQAGTPSEAPLQWTRPSGWQETERGEMRLASFRIVGVGGKTADVSVIALPGIAGGDLSNVNRWRGQVGLPAIRQDELSKLAKPVVVGDSSGTLFDLAGTAASGDATRVLAAILHRADAVWFFKMTGDDELAAKQKPAFIEFLKSVKFAGAVESQAALPAGHPSVAESTAALPSGHPAIGAMPPANATSTSSAPAAQWQVPASWTEEPPTQMLLAKFSAKDKGTRADITVSAFPGDVGGLLANVNRWRRQVNLPPVDQTQLARTIETIKVQSDEGTLVKLENPDAKSPSLIGAAVPHKGQTWFFKMLGDGKLVAREEKAFRNFVQNVKLPDAP